MSDNQQQFEDLIRRTLEDFEVDFNPGHWQEMESRLNLLGQGVAVSMNTFYGAFVAAGIFMAGLIYFGLPDDHTGGFAEQEQITELQTQGNPTGSETIVAGDSPEKETVSTDTFIMDVPHNSIEKFVESPGISNSVDTDNEKANSEGPKVEYGEMTVKKIRSSVSQGCEGSPITFSTSGSESEGNFLWNFGDGYFSNNQNPVHVFDAPGIFDVSLLVTPLTGGKLTPMTIEDQIKINPRPKASFDYTYKQNPLDIPQVKFESHSKNVDQVMWVVNGEIFSEEDAPIQNFTKKGTYDVQLVAINEYGCADTTSRKVTIKEDYNLMSPASFTPDGDNRGDTFMPGALKLIDGEFVLRVVDPRTDMVIFESKDYNQPWDGTIAGTSVKASGGEYHWEANVTYQDGKTDQFTGQIRLTK